ncbi:hypothetical protein MNV_60084 [Candidatus Methanoperedens nitroreducens]|uniref:Uncharacterized protein n=1 Tax=Candidatus Methanoperedens nitratireducens TaxID=1392998 RepID=A0A284VSN9_9EURY|nr:hypothetical protein MNV_60084 [Candidatus Methanoperedens nitroreducens]
MNVNRKKDDTLKINIRLWYDFTYGGDGIYRRACSQGII